MFEEKVRMWMYEEKVDGRNLTDIVNTEHENVKYLPGVKLPTNVVSRWYSVQLLGGGDDDDKDDVHCVCIVVVGCDYVIQQLAQDVY